MSEYVSYSFQLPAKRQRELRLSRIRTSTRRYYDRYRRLHDQLLRDGADQYLPEEFDRAGKDLDTIQRNLDSDPEAARDLSIQLGQFITQLPTLARAARREFEARERQRRKQLEERKRKAKSELEVFLNEQISSFNDPVVRDFAYEQLHSLQDEYEDREVSPDLLESEKEILGQRLQAIRSEAESKASAWKSKKSEESRIESQRAALDIHRENIAQDQGENPKVIQHVLEGIGAIQQKLKEGTALRQEDLLKQLQKTVEEADEAVADEQYRKETVKAVVTSLRKAGFVVDAPRRHREEGDDDVVVRARKPAGNKAEIHVKIDGGFLYRFDNYEGMSCRKDIGAVLSMLDDVYGVKLSDKRVLWQNNPDRIFGTARPLDSDDMEQRNG